jgi:predicted HAD superfamily Cof-like phosphohydrolase
MTREDKVKEFHKAFGHPIGGEWTEELMAFRIDLITEELEEVLEACENMVFNPYEGCEAALLKELADIQYVVSGMAVALGLNLEEAFNRVHESNMSKLGEDGKPIYRFDGKVLKGPNYKEPDLEDLI